jgi:hypothetical protein
LKFVGTDLATGDNTVFIDNVRISPPIQAQPSSVTLTSPANNASFLSSETISLAVSLVPNGNVINEVQFHANATNLLGQATTAPYNLLWTNVPAGNYNLIASVIFNGGGVASSGSINITVTNLPPVIGQVELAGGGQQLSILANGQADHPYVLEGTTNLVPPIIWSPLLTNTADALGNITFPNWPITNAQQFFRIAAP